MQIYTGYTLSTHSYEIPPTSEIYRLLQPYHRALLQLDYMQPIESQGRRWLACANCVGRRARARGDVSSRAGQRQLRAHELDGEHMVHTTHSDVLIHSPHTGVSPLLSVDPDSESDSLLTAGVEDVTRGVSAVIREHGHIRQHGVRSGTHRLSSQHRCEV